MRKLYYWAADCPVCGEKDEEYQYKGARMGSTAWGHDYLCCSDKCGFAFKDSPKRRKMDMAKLVEKRNSINRQIKNLGQENKVKP